MSRSLQASTAGIERAKRALVRKSLTQKAIANELAIASWSTVNKFFNGKAIDRFLFQEICTALDLDWQDIVKPESLEPPPPPLTPPPLTPSPLLPAVQQQALAAREALTPRILERIPRAIVQEEYRVAIDRSLKGQSQIIPIVAPAGYGKSTILGDLYDQLNPETPWLGLILCSTLSLSTGFLSFMTSTYLLGTMGAGSSGYSAGSYQTPMLETAFGNSLCGQSQSILDIVKQLTESCGKGILLIDTIDLVINREFVPAFNPILKQLLELGVTIVFTCRDHEYNDYLEPTHERMAGMTQRVDRHSVPNFTTAEIRMAAEAFFRKLKPNEPERGCRFADNILTLSADNRSLRDIVQNPLLLALLCDLFGQEEYVPPDLTVSKLYQRYWQEKIAYSRADQSHTVLLAIEKDNLCLAISRTLFEMSQGKLCESAYRDEFGVQFTESVIKAYDDLLSEGVLERLPSTKIHFFHQTLLEYAIAYWLTRRSAQAQRQQWLEQIKQSASHWYPVLRQHLTILETDTEFEELVQQLDLSNVGVFGAIAYAAASRDQPTVFMNLLPEALKLGGTHQERLHQALEIAPRSWRQQLGDSARLGIE